MDIIQEHIKLLRAQFALIQKQCQPVKRYRAGRNCRKGYNCGGSCITRSKNCRKALEGEAKNFSEWMINKMIGNMGAVLGEKPKVSSGGLDPAINKQEYDRLVGDGTYGKQAEIWANSKLSYDEKIQKDAELASKSQEEFERLIASGVDEESALILKDEWLMSDAEKAAAKETIKEIQSQSQGLNDEIKDAESKQLKARQDELDKRQKVKQGKVKDTELTADQVKGFKEGSDRVIRKPDGTYIESKNGETRKIKSDVMDDTVKATLDEIGTGQIQRAIKSIHKTPYLSAEGKAERIKYLRDLQEKRLNQKIERERRRAKDASEQMYNINGVNGTIDELAYLFPDQIKSPGKPKVKPLTLSEVKSIDDRLEFNLQQIKSAMRRKDQSAVEKWQNEQKKAIEARRAANEKSSNQKDLFKTDKYNDDGVRFNRNPRR